jgi:xylan 1,4-beta-xylosidase
MRYLTIPRILLILSAIAVSRPVLSQQQRILTYCNPLDIDYRYDWEHARQNISYRAGADPVLVPFRGAYYLFVTNSAGWWRSTDLAHWQFVAPDVWPSDDVCAPAVAVVRDTLYLFQSTFDRRPLYFTTAPQTGHLAFFNPLMPKMSGALGPWDPDIFHDPGSDRWYMYFGSSNYYPIYGIELDHSHGLSYIGPPKPLLRLDPQRHGWERFGRDHRDTTTPFIEGTWMTKHGGKFFLQYAAPGTEYNVYANGTYIGDSPLGPFTYAPYNPVSYKPGGFMAGAGHGNTFQDLYGNYWNTGTPWVAVNWNFERRVSMFPAGFDRDNEMFSDTRFGDFPHYVPRYKWTDTDSLFTGWMLLSYRKPVTASSARDSFPPSTVTDENPRTFWVAEENAPGEWIIVDLLREDSVMAVQVNFTDYHSGLFFTDDDASTRFRLFGSKDGRHWSLLADLSHERRDRPNAYIPLVRPEELRYVKYEHVHVDARNLAISDIRIFGHGDGVAPHAPALLQARREEDQRNAVIQWSPVADVVGYNVRWGIAPDKLHQTYQRFADQGTTLEVRSLTVGQTYYFAVEAFDENGVSPLSKILSCPRREAR